MDEQEYEKLRLKNAEKIADNALSINAIKLQSDNPFTWASGFKMPIYNDNRMLLGNFEHRIDVKDAFINNIIDSGIDFDLISGTSTSGVAPAVSVANALGKNLVILVDNTPYIFDSNKLDKTVGDIFGKMPSYVDAVATTFPGALPIGVNLADMLKVPFMYVRPGEKKHGLGNKVEGIPKEGQRVLLIDYPLTQNYGENARLTLQNLGMEVIPWFFKKLDVFKADNLHGKKIGIIEDLVSTGGSFLKEGQRYRDIGAIFDHAFAIFSYDLDVANKKCSNADITMSPSLTYDVVLDRAVKTGYIKPEQQQVLAVWRQNPFDWEVIYGHETFENNQQKKIKNGMTFDKDVDAFKKRLSNEGHDLSYMVRNK
jgi:orotate phosphoribosyltransferase